MQTRMLLVALPLMGTIVYACASSTSPTATPDGGAASTSLHYFSDPCGNGDPVGCSFTSPEDVPSKDQKCSELGVKETDVCPTEGARCVLVPGMREADGGEGCTSSPSYLTCLPERRDAGRAGCPKSLASVKKSIHYLSPEERTRVAAEVRALPLVTYRYKAEPDEATPTVGMIIDDVPTASFVERKEHRVNLYSYASAAIAAVQEQDREVAELRARVARLEELCAPRK